MTARLPLRWGLLGTGRINRSLIPAVRASARGVVAAAGSRDLARAQAHAAEWQIPNACGSYAELIARADVDIVYIALPNDLHAEWTLRSLEAGKHVLVEKPIALRASDVDAIATAAKKHDRHVAEAFMYRHHPQTLKLKELVDAGTLGALEVVRGTFSFELTRPADVRLGPAPGGGSLWDVGCYPVSLAQYLVGSAPIEVFGWQRLGPTGVDLTFAGQMRYAGGVLGQFDCGFAAPFRTHFEAVGRAAAVTVAQPFKPGLDAALTLRRNPGEETIAIPPAPLYEGEVEDLHDAILGVRLPRVTLAESRNHIATIEALYASALSGKVEPVGA
jgi:D-xylose 1-dehydrogenase (NADP+, D-xylono-1,5-lactone-forming)